MARPVVTLHFAQSLDGRLGLGREAPRALLSSEQGVASAHRARSEHDAVLVGIETALHDDPLLTARGEGAPSQPLRVVLDSALRLPPTSRLLSAGQGAGRAILLAVAERASPERRALLERAGADVRLVAADGSGRTSLRAALAQLAELGVQRLLVEGGSKVLSSFLRERLADRAEIEIAPYFLGSPGGCALAELGVQSLGVAPRLEHASWERLGASLLLAGDIAYPARGA